MSVSKKHRFLESIGSYWYWPRPPQNHSNAKWILSRFFKRICSSQGVWPQISGRDLEDWGEKSWRFPSEICGQTSAAFKPADYQFVTKWPCFWWFCQIFLPILTYLAIHIFGSLNRLSAWRKESKKTGKPSRSKPTSELKHSRTPMFPKR